MAQKIIPVNAASTSKSMRVEHVIKNVDNDRMGRIETKIDRLEAIVLQMRDMQNDDRREIFEFNACIDACEDYSKTKPKTWNAKYEYEEMSKSDREDVQNCYRKCDDIKPKTQIGC